LNLGHAACIAAPGDAFEPVLRAIETGAELAGVPDLDALLAARTAEGGLPQPAPGMPHPFRTASPGAGLASNVCCKLVMLSQLITTSSATCNDSVGNQGRWILVAV
jgi:hypothetical protein